MDGGRTRDPVSEEPIQPKPEGRATLEVDDELRRFSAEVGGDVGAEDVDDETERGDAPQPTPFRIGLPRPRAIDLIALWRLSKKKPDPLVRAALGPKMPILLSHGITAFPAPARKPARVWGLGYDCSIFDVEADTVAVAPSTELLDIASVGANASIEVQLDGGLGVPEPLKEAASLIPGVTLTEASVHIGDDVNAAVFLNFRVSVPKVISGPDRDGGASWSLYSQDRQIAGYQPLFQTILVPEGTRSIRVDVKSWVREAGWLGPAKTWRFETQSFEVPLTTGGTPARHVRN